MNPEELVNFFPDITRFIEVKFADHINKYHKDKRSVFVPPTEEEVTAYMNEHNFYIDVKHFIQTYGMGGWMISKNKPMKDWRLAAQKAKNWECNIAKQPKPAKPIAKSEPVPEAKIITQEEKARLLRESQWFAKGFGRKDYEPSLNQKKQNEMRKLGVGE